MLYPITLWLWAILAHTFAPNGTNSNHPLQPQPNSPLTSAPTPPPDSIPADWQARLEGYHLNGAPEKCYLQLDRTLFQPGETVWFSAYLRDAANLMPALNSQILYVELLDPRGSAVQHKTLFIADGQAAGEFLLDAGWPGGLYKIRAYSNWMRNDMDRPTFEREITLQKVVLPRLNLKLEFERKAHGPGDAVVARFDGLRLDNQPLANQKLHFTASAGGAEFTSGEATTDASGRTYVHFTLPEKLESADGLLNIQTDFNGQSEAISRAIPIVLNKIDLQFFPEGGDAVAGLPCSMAFKAVNEFGKPADVEGVILCFGSEVAHFSSFHDGMGAFQFTPQPGQHYVARITKPFASEKLYDLPPAKPSGQVLHLEKSEERNLLFQVASSQSGTAYLLGTARDKVFFFKELKLSKAAQEVNISTADLPIGIARFTMLDAEKNPVAERLAFVNRDRSLKIDMIPDREEYLPRDQVKLKILVRDHAGHPVQGQFSLAVADDAQLTFADDKQGHLLASLLLEQDVKGRIEEPNFYFDEKETKSVAALDYLLMTQGWRRFTWKKILAEEKSTPQFAAERTDVKGWASDAIGKPLSRAKVSLYPNGPKTLTDASGYFVFEKVDFSRYTHVQYGKQTFSPIYAPDRFVYLQDSKKIQQPAAQLQRINTNGAVLLGQIQDSRGEPMIGASVKVLKDRDRVRGTSADVQGNYRFNLDPGNYTVEVHYSGYAVQRVFHVSVHRGHQTVQNLVLANPQELSPVSIVDYRAPLIEQDNTSAGQTLTSEQIKNLPTRTLEQIVAVAGGEPNDEDGPIHIAGSRSNATNYYIDGIRVAGEAPPVQDLKEDRQEMKAGRDDEGPNLSEVMIVNYKVPLVEADKMEEGAVFTGEQLLLRSSASGKAKKQSWYGGMYSNQNYHYASHFSSAREFYSPQYKGKSAAPDTHDDFRSTLYWNPKVQTDRQGEATVSFFTSDAITNFRATLEGIGSTGIPGRGERHFFVQKPVSLAVKTPPYVIAGDVLRLQVAISNKTRQAFTGQFSFTAPAHFSLQKINGQHPQATHSDPRHSGSNVLLAAGKTQTISLEFAIGQPIGTEKNQELSIQFQAGKSLSDAMKTSIPTLDRGFPVRQVASGQSAQNAFDLHLIEPVEGTMSLTLTAYPNALEDVLKGMERMLGQPCGCFEQVSSTNYPNLLVLDLLRQTGTSRPEVEDRAHQLLADGYEKLAAYECPKGGFDWWGRDPGHEGLTAYGLLEFTDMARVYPVDQALIDRTINWLLSRRDGKGGWQRRPDHLHTWNSDAVLDAYIAWAVAEAGQGQRFAPEIDHAHELALKSGDPYLMALMANAQLVRKDGRGTQLLADLLKKQEADGSFMGADHFDHG